jgi:ABC-type multidrug transport system fused ATPase/permease subunit
MNRLARELRERSADLGTLFVETLMGIRLMACFNAGDCELDRFQKHNDSFVDTLLRWQAPRGARSGRCQRRKAANAPDVFAELSDELRRKAPNGK